MSSSVRRAVIDIGTNSVKLLVAEVVGGDVRPVHEDSIQTRLGKGFYETHELQPEAVKQTASAVAEFAKTAKEGGAGSIRVIATSATRDAKNPGDLISAVDAASGLRIEVISGEQEADWAFQGVTSDPKLAKHPLLLLDVGGGSTEFILGQGEHKYFKQSFHLGTVRLMEKFPVSDPPSATESATARRWVRAFLEKEVKPKLEPVMAREMKSHAGVKPWLIGTGGTATILARLELKLDEYDRERIEAARLPLARVRWQREHLWGVALAERKKIVGLPPKRADVILAGVMIYEAVMEVFGFEELRVSMRGLRFAAMMTE